MLRMSPLPKSNNALSSSPGPASKEESLQNEIKSLTDKYQELARQHASLRTKLSEQKGLGVLRREVDAQQKAIEEHKQTEARLDEKCKELKTKLAAIEAKLAETESEYAREIQAREATERVLDQEREKNKKNIGHAQGVYKKLVSQVNKESNARETVTENLENIQKDNLHLKDTTKKIIASSSQIAKLKASKSSDVLWSGISIFSLIGGIALLATAGLALAAPMVVAVLLIIVGVVSGIKAGIAYRENQLIEVGIKQQNDILVDNQNTLEKYLKTENQLTLPLPVRKLAIPGLLFESESEDDDEEEEEEEEKTQEFNFAETSGLNRPSHVAFFPASAADNSSGRREHNNRNHRRT